MPGRDASVAAIQSVDSPDSRNDVRGSRPGGLKDIDEADQSPSATNAASTPAIASGSDPS